MSIDEIDEILNDSENMRCLIKCMAAIYLNKSDIGDYSPEYLNPFYKIRPNIDLKLVKMLRIIVTNSEHARRVFCQCNGMTVCVLILKVRFIA